MLTMWGSIPMLDRVFDDVGTAFGDATNTAAFTPAVDVIAKDNEIVFQLDVPGVKRDELELIMENRVLTIKGSRHHTLKDNEKVTLGRPYGDFTMSYVLPDFIDGEQMSADLADGVLTVHFPKLEKALPRKIVIKGGVEVAKELNE